MRYAWDLFRWRFVAAYYIAWWLLKGAPMKDLPCATRFLTIRWSWTVWRNTIMFPHEQAHMTADEFLKKLKEVRDR